MSYSTCLTEAINQNQVKGDLLKELQADIEAYRHKARAEGLSDLEIEEFAAKNALIQAATKKKRAKHQKYLQAMAQINARNIAQSHTRSFEQGVMSLLDKDLRNHAGKTTHGNVHYRAQSIEGQAHSRFKKGLEALHTTHLGLGQDRVTLRDTVRQLFGQNTGNKKAVDAAKGFTESSEYLRQRFNRAGGYIAKRDDWALPQGHNQSRVSRASKEDWVKFITPMLNTKQMVDEFGVPLTDDALLEGLENSYHNIITNGWSAKGAGNQGKGKLANRHQDSRFLIFKDADAWLEYQEKFGDPDIFSTMTGHLRHMSNEIALLEILGPNPEHTFKYLKDLAGEKGIKNASLLDATYNVVSGKADMIAEGKYAENISATTGFVRHGLIAAQLGSAAISSIGDPIFGKMTRAYNGIPATQMIQQVVKQLDPTNDADRAWAAHMGLTLDSWTRNAIASARFAGETDAGGVMQKVSESVMRGSGLQSWTAAHRNAFGLDFQWHLGQQVQKPLSQIEGRFQAMLRRYGITDDMWDVMRKSPLEDHGNARYFRPDNIRKIDGISDYDADMLSSRLLDAMNTEMDFANPMPSARERAIMTAGKARGTIMGETARMGTMYKGFALSVLNTHVMRSITKDWSGKTDYLYLIRLVAGLSIMGGLAIQLKDIAKGKEPRDMDTPEFLFAAISQGGGLGILGDFLYTGFAGKSRHGDNLATTLAGPGIGFMADTFELGFSGVAGATFAGDKTNFGRELSNYLKSYTPGNSLWYTRVITERMLFDQFQRLADPKAQSSWQNTEKRLLKQQGQRYWWKKGKTAPTF